MMQTLRKYMKHILWVVAVAFIATIVFSWGMGGFKNRGSQLEKGIVGVINGQEIQFQQFRMLLDQEYDKVKEQYPDGEIPEFRRRALRDQVWQTIVRDVLFQQEIKRLGLSAAPQEVVFVLQNNPPEFLRSQQEFQTDGQFDISKYRQALSDPRNYDAWIPVENYLRSSLPPQKLTQRILTTARITDSEIRQGYRLENQQVNAEYLFFDPNRVSLENIIVSDRDIADYYKAHLDEYKDPEKRKIQYVKLDGRPSGQDSSQVREDIMQILDLIRDGEDFETLARENSEDGSAEQGGDLGFFGRGQMVKPFEDAAFNASVGEVVGPVQTQFGEHIIKVIARKTENGELKVRARHILLKYKATPETYDAMNDQADYIYEELQRTKGKFFDQLAMDEHLELMETDFFPAGGFIPGLGMASRISHFTFLEDKNWFSRPMGLGEDIIIFQITDIQPERTKPVEEVHNSIQRILERDKKMEAAGEACRRFHAGIGASGNLKSAAERDSLDLKVTGPFALQGYVPEVGKDAAFAGAAFRLPVNTISEPVKGTRGWYLIKPIEKIDINEESLQAIMQERRRTMQQTKMQQIYMAWFNALQEKADIEDNRSLFF